MKVVFAEGSDNVGDDLNAWIWSALTGDIHSEGTALLGIGTLLNAEFCRRLEGVRKICVMGTGAGYGKPPVIDERWHFYSVRGMGTAAALSLPADRAVADAAYLMATLDWAQYREARSSVVVVPHHRSLRYLDWQAVCERAGLQFLSPLTPPAEFMKALTQARLVITEAMHGAILADIARVPWTGFSFGGQFNPQKWGDWAGMFDLTPEIRPLGGFYDRTFFGADRQFWYHASKNIKVGLGRLGVGRQKWRKITPPSLSIQQSKRQLAARLASLSLLPGQLSNEQVLNARVDQLYLRLAQLRTDLGFERGARLSGDPLAFLENYAPTSVPSAKVA
ncbi:polysaccharide pyruvyl transferase family protein [Pseudomonas sp. TE3610]